MHAFLLPFITRQLLRPDQQLPSSSQHLCVGTGTTDNANRSNEIAVLPFAVTLAVMLVHVCIPCLNCSQSRRRLHGPVQPREAFQRAHH